MMRVVDIAGDILKQKKKILFAQQAKTVFGPATTSKFKNLRAISDYLIIREANDARGEEPERRPPKKVEKFGIISQCHRVFSLLDHKICCLPFAVYSEIEDSDMNLLCLGYESVHGG